MRVILYSSAGVTQIALIRGTDLLGVIVINRIADPHQVHRIVVGVINAVVDVGGGLVRAGK